MKGTLPPKSQRTYFGVAKEVRKSFVDDDGEVIFPVNWNNGFIDLPKFNKHLQLRGKVSAQDIERLIGLPSNESVWMLYFLRPAAGMRTAELLSVEIDKPISPHCSMIPDSSGESTAVPSVAQFPPSQTTSGLTGHCLSQVKDVRLVGASSPFVASTVQS